MSDANYSDVLIAGGGPAGSTLAAKLLKETTLSVRIIEKEEFPRDHIGESFASPAVPCMTESGVLEKVLKSGCSIKKYGGYYSWGQPQPAASFFRHRNWEQDGVRRWSMHVNRADFDNVLLEHARSSGAMIANNERVVSSDGDSCKISVKTDKGSTYHCRYFVDASGRSTKINKNSRLWLSKYKNVAVWAHFRNGKNAQSINAEWNIFHKSDLSPIACFAFELGWCWYIPIPIRKSDGSIEQVHSIGIVTEATAINAPASRLRSMTGFTDAIRNIDQLSDLIVDAKPIYTDLHFASNYSMIRNEMANYRERTLTIGDASFFVDPLFSSGVSFSMLQAMSACELIKATEATSFSESEKLELWDDYTIHWRRTAQSFSMGIDQWYAAISDRFPTSMYWADRAEIDRSKVLLDNFSWLLDTDFNTDLMQVITEGSGSLSVLHPEGSIRVAIQELGELDPPVGARVRLPDDYQLCESVVLHHSAPPKDNKSTVWENARYWKDPVDQQHAVSRIFSQPIRCYRLTNKRPNSGLSAKDLVIVDLTEVKHRFLQKLLTYEWFQLDQLQKTLDSECWSIVQRLIAADILESEEMLEASTL